MIIAHRSIFHILHIINRFNRLLLGLGGIFLIVFLFQFIRREEKSPLVFKEKKTSNFLEEVKRDYSLIGEGALRLSDELGRFPFPDLSGELLFISCSSRPDTTLYERKIKMGIRGSSETIEVASGQILYLSYDQDHLTFSETLTPLWIKPKLGESLEPTLEMGVDLVGKKGQKILSEKREIKLVKEWSPLLPDQVKDEKLKEGIRAIQLGTWWGADHLYDCYGGKSYEKYKGRERVELPAGEFLFVVEGSCFFWEEGSWRPGKKRESPLAIAKEVTPYKMHWQFWSDNGLETAVVQLNKERCAPISLRIENVFTRIRQRTASRISCRVDSRATILKKGDWLLHTNKGWHRVKSLSEIESVLQLKSLGELFVFDGIEVDEGKQVFCGTLFNSMRTEHKEVRLPITQKRPAEHSPHIKKHFSSKIRSPSSDEIQGSRPKLKNAPPHEPNHGNEIIEKAS